MSRFQALITDIYDAIAAIPELNSKLGNGDWLDFDLPPSPDKPELFPVVRIEGIYVGDDRLSSYPMTLKLWAFDDGDKLAFLELAEGFKDALSTKSKLLDSQGYVLRHEPQSQLFCALFDVTAYLR